MKKVIVATLLVVSLLSSACTAQPIVCRNVHEIVYDSRGNPYDVVRRDIGICLDIIIITMIGMIDTINVVTNTVTDKLNFVISK